MNEHIKRVKELAVNAAFYRRSDNNEDDSLRINCILDDIDAFLCTDENTGDEFSISFADVPVGAIFYRLVPDVVV